MTKALTANSVVLFDSFCSAKIVFLPKMITFAVNNQNTSYVKKKQRNVL